MKKFFVIALAALGMVACVNDGITELPNGGEITFGDAFINNSTRAAVDPSYTKSTLDKFNVWGYVENTTGTVFEGVEVTNNDGVGTYSGTQYWAPSKNYYFAAVAGVATDKVTTENNVKPTAIAFENTDGSQDLIYAYKAVTSAPAGQDNPAVALEFNHLLSKVKFTFQNGFTAGNVDVKVVDIKMQAVKSANYNIESAAWENLSTEKVNLAFGETEKMVATVTEECADERLVIPTPSTQEYEISFGVEVYNGDVLVNEATKTSKVLGVALEKGKAYNFTAVVTPETLGMDAIEFTVTVNDWETPVEEAVDYTYDAATKTYTLLTAEGFKWFADEANNGNTFKGYTINLATNVDITALSSASTRATTYAEWTPIKRFEGTFNGNGHIVENFKVTTQEGYAGLFGYVQGGTIKNLIVKNVSIIAHHYAGAIVGQGYVYMSDCHVENVDITLTTKANDWGDKAGGIIGQILEGGMYVKNSTAKDVTIKGYRDLGGIAGMAQYNNIISGCSVENITITQDLSVNYQNNTPTTLGGVVGRFGTPVTYENCSEKNVNIAVNAETAADFATAVKADRDIMITLQNDMEVAISSLGEQTGGSGEYKLGGENTKKITIDLNDKKLNITTTYWSAIGANNNDAVFTIKNGTMTSTGNSAGTWNAWDLRFSNCNYVFEDVTFEKAVALDNAGKSTKMTGVTITDAREGDTYGLWITAEGQTVTLEECVIDMTPATDGRGIKIDEQYVDAPAKVTLNVNGVTFKTEEKAAVVVKSVAGAEINWGEGNNIEAVAADSDFAVWVDEDAKAHAAKVVVNGAMCKVEGSTSEIIEESTQEALNNAIGAVGNGESATLVLPEGNYTMPSVSNKEVTIIGDENTVITVNKPACHGGDVTFTGVTIQASGMHTGVQHVNTVTYNDVTINGTMNLYGKKVVFNGCTFNLSGDYIWTYGAEEVEFNNCTFDTTGKAILIYKDGGAISTKVTVKGCTFNATASAKASAISNQNCAAIEMHNYESNITLITEKNTVSDKFSGEWRIKQYENRGFTITVNGVEYTKTALDGKLMTVTGGVATMD